MPRKPSLVINGLPPDLPDRPTALADLRIALCLHLDIHPDDIHPASGYSLTLDTYLSIRAQWAEQHEKNSDEWTWRNSAEVRADWERNRPQYLVDHPWPEIRVMTYEEELEAAGFTDTPAKAAHAIVDVPLPDMPTT